MLQPTKRLIAELGLLGFFDFFFSSEEEKLVAAELQRGMAKPSIQIDEQTATYQLVRGRD